MHFSRFILVTAFLLCLVIGKVAIQKRPGLLNSLKGPDLESPQVSYQAASLKKMAFGFESFLSSLLWLRLLQEAKTTAMTNGAISWEASEVDAITTLDPNFESAYSFGSLYVSFFRRDKEGGKRILEKWVNHSPIYWKPHHLLGMHYFLELKDYASAAPHIIKASQLPGAPGYISSLGVGLLGQAGATHFALQSAIELFEIAVQPAAKFRLAKRIKGLRWNLTKQAWESALVDYQKTNQNRKPSSLKDLVPFVKLDPIREISGLKSVSSDLAKLLSERFNFKLSETRDSIIPENAGDEAEFGKIGVYLEGENK